MFEQQAESDEDCEVYFLKPVNEYNIVDKIKEANKELFANASEDNGSTVNDNSAATTPTENGNTIISRKVTFALNLEDYEPTAQNKVNMDLQGATNADDAEAAEMELVQQLTQLKVKSERFAPIVEEELHTVEEQVQPEQPIEPEPGQLETENEPIEEEEICEEILDLMEMDSLRTAQEQANLMEDDVDFPDDLYDTKAQLNEVSELTGSGVATTQRRMGRQNTFDYDGESDNKSLTNLLTESDCEEEERTLNEARLKLRQAYKNLYKTLDAEQQAKIDELTGGVVTKTEPMPNPAIEPSYVPEDDEDDDLSLIVASYIPENFELNEHSIYYKKDVVETSNNHNSKSIANNSATTSTKTFFNARRFSFRRKTKPTYPSQAVPEIKLNYKTCCEHRHSLQDKLPRYMGYLSEYGLSEQQLQQRDQRMRRKQRFVLEQAVNRNEQELKKMQDNERAFTTWLKNKMRYPINKTRNMFDAKLRRGSVAAAATSRQKEPQQQQQPHHGAYGVRRDSNEVHTYRHLLGHWNK